MRVWPSVFGAFLLTVLVVATVLGSRTDMSCPPSARSVEALFAPCIASESVPAKIAGQSFEERWRIAAGALNERE